MPSLKDQATSGIKWSTIAQIGRQGTQLVTTVILARLLPPSDFGLMGMAMVVIGFIGIFKDLGTSAAIIQKKQISKTLLSSIFWINVGFGTLAMIILFIAAPFGSSFYYEPRVTPILQILSLSFFISSLSILQKSLLEKSLSFNTLAKVEINAVVCGSILGVGLALSGAGVWSLIFQSLTTVSVTTVLLWFSSPWRPTWAFHWKEVKSVSSYSLNLTGFSIFNYFARNVDYLLIGRYLGAQELGYYTLAYRILLFPLQNISAVIGRVMFPIFSSIQDDNCLFSSAYLKVVGTIALIAFPLMMGVLALADPFISTVFDAKWQPVILLIMILAPVGLVQSIGKTVGAIYQAKGRTDWMFRWGIIAGLLVMIAIAVGLKWGIVGVATAYAITSLSLSYFNFAIPFRLIDLKFIQLLKVLWKPFANSFLMFMILISFRVALPSSISNGVVLILSISLGIGFYIVINRMTNQEQLTHLWNLVRLKKKAKQL